MKALTTIYTTKIHTLHTLVDDLAQNAFAVRDFSTMYSLFHLCHSIRMKNTHTYMCSKCAYLYSNLSRLRAKPINKVYFNCFVWIHIRMWCSFKHRGLLFVFHEILKFMAFTMWNKCFPFKHFTSRRYIVLAFKSYTSIFNGEKNQKNKNKNKNRFIPNTQS